MRKRNARVFALHFSPMLALRPPPARAGARLAPGARPGRHSLALPRLAGTQPLTRRAGPGDAKLGDAELGRPTSASATKNGDASPLDALATLSRTDAYRGPLQIAIFLVVFMVFDAAWSGDWSRIGAISKDTEAALKPVTFAITAVHLASAGVAFTAASGRGKSPTLPVLKALAVGVLAGVEAWFDDE